MAEIAQGRVLAETSIQKEEIEMSTLIGVYRNPDEARIEMDDEARRTIDSVLRSGGRIAGSFGSKTGKAGLEKLMRDVADRSKACVDGRGGAS